jgi:tryptophan 7-halogenase
MENRTTKTVAIVGGDIAGWMSAALLKHTLGNSVSITLIDLGTYTTDVLTQATIPPIKAFHNSLGLNELDIIAKCQGSMKLGTQFVNWGTLGNRYFHPHGTYGAEFDIVPLHQWWLKARGADDTVPDLADLSMSWALAQEGRFTMPVADRRMIQSTIDYAFHLDPGLYREYLKRFATSCGVNVIATDLASVDCDPETGFVTQIVLKNGDALDADLFIDCSHNGALLKQIEGTDAFIDWTASLPCNRAITVSSKMGGEFTPFTRITARDAGWQWRMPLQHCTSLGYVFASDLISDDDAVSALMDNLDGPAIADPIITSFVNGRRKDVFYKNVVAIGDAAGFLEPLEATRLHFVQSALTRLLALWPTRDCSPVLTRQYNELTAAEWDLARDMLILHYKLTARTDTSLWRTCKDMTIPDSLQTRLEHWENNGRLVSPRPELFQSASWLSVLVGQGHMPQAWDPLADAREDRVDYQARLAGIARVIQDTATQMPLHRDWIDKHARGVRV